MALSSDKVQGKFFPLKEDYDKLQMLAKHKERLSSAKLIERLMLRYLEENKEWLAENMKGEAT